MNFELGKMSDAPSKTLTKPSLMCREPMHLIGVQEETPLDWSPDGSRFLFTSENHSIYICSFNEEKDGSVSVAFSAWRACVYRKGGERGGGASKDARWREKGWCRRPQLTISGLPASPCLSLSSMYLPLFHPSLMYFCLLTHPHIPMSP